MNTLPSLIQEKIFIRVLELKANETGHVQCIKQYWFQQHKEKLWTILRDLDDIVGAFAVFNRVTGEFKSRINPFSILMQKALRFKPEDYLVWCDNGHLTRITFLR